MALLLGIGVAPATARRTRGSHPRLRIERVIGKVVRVRASAREVALEDDQGQERSFEVPARAPLHRGRRRIRLQDIRVGDRAAVTYEILQGRSIVRDLRVRPVP